MKKQINDLLLKMQTGENCIGETANKLLDLYSVRHSASRKGTITAEEFFRNKIREQNPNREVVTLSQELITAEQGLQWAHEFKQLHLHNVVQQSELLFCKCGSVKNGGYGCMRTDCDNTLLAFMQNNCG